MRVSRSDLAARGLLLGALAIVGVGAAVPVHLHAQDPAIVSKTVSVGSGEAALSVGLSNGSEVAIRFGGGAVTIDGETVGTYVPGGELENSWRGLIARAVQLDDGPLGEALAAWQPPEGLTGETAELGALVDRTLEGLLVEGNAPAAAPDAPRAPGVVDGGTLSRLFSQVDMLGDLGALLGDAALDDLRIVLDQDLEVAADMVLEGDVLVIGGDVEIDGRIRGDLLVVDGDIELRDGGIVEGDLRYVDGYLDFEGGEVRGSVAEITSDAIVVDTRFRDELAEQIRADVEAEVRAKAPRSRRVGVFHRLGRAFGDIFETLTTIFVIGIFGVMVNFFAGEHIDRVSDVARRTPGRAAAVGLAAAFLSFPVWIIGIIGLAISIIGIPALILWVPGVPLLLALAAGFGYVAVARNVGTWLSRQDIPWFDWVRVTRPNSLIFGGVGVLLSPYLVAALLGVVPLLGGFQELATFVGVMLGVMATAAGFGAVLVTRGGRRADYSGDDWYDDLQDLGSDLGDLRGFASDFGRRWTRGDRTDAHAEDAASDETAASGTEGEPESDRNPHAEGRAPESGSGAEPDDDDVAEADTADDDPASSK